MDGELGAFPLKGCKMDISRADVSPSAKDILALEDARAKGMLLADTEALHRLLAEDLTYGHSSGAMDSKNDLLAKLQTGRLKFAELRLLEVTPRLTEKCAFVTGRMLASVVFDGLPKSVQTAYLAVWAPESTGGAVQWRLWAYQATPLAYPNPLE
jgi:hypothetical protein